MVCRGRNDRLSPGSTSALTIRPVDINPRRGGAVRRRQLEPERAFKMRRGGKQPRFLEWRRDEMNAYRQTIG